MNLLYFLECFISSIVCFCLPICSDINSISLFIRPILLLTILPFYAVFYSLVNFVFDIDWRRLTVDDLMILLFFFYCRICSNKFYLSNAGIFLLANYGILFSQCLTDDCWVVLVPHHFLRVPKPSIRVLNDISCTVCI